jgi:hypothetical protein
LETSIQPLKKLTANHLPVIFKSNTETRIKNFEFFTSSPAYGTIYLILNHRRLPECRNKHFEEGFSKDLTKLVSVFIEASKNLNLHFLH